MSNYAEILRHSRLVALPPRLKVSSPAHNLYPTSPAIQTSRANQNIGDWGLKRNLPRLRTDNITISDIDTQEHQTPFTAGNKYTKFVKRWQEMGIPMKPRTKANYYAEVLTRESEQSQPEGQRRGIHLASAPRKQVSRLVKKAGKLRRTFLAAQGSKNAVYTQELSSTLRQAGQAFLGIQASQNRTYEMHTSAGLGYHLHGALPLINTPTGALERTVTARVLHAARNTTLVGLAGLQTELKQRYDAPPSRAQGRTSTFPVYPVDAEVSHQGTLSVTLYDTRPNQFDSDKASGISAFANLFDNEKGYAEDDMESSADSITGGRKGARKGTMSALSSLLASSPVGKR